MLPVTIVAVALSVVFFAVAFVLRSIVQWKRTGDAGFRLARSADGLPKLASLLMVVGFLMMFAALLLDLGGQLEPIASLDHSVLHVSGVTLMAFALLVTVKAQFDLRESWRIGVDPEEHTDLVTDAAFSVVRNPIFTGMLLFGVGAAAVVPNWLTLAGAAVVVAGLELQVRGVEEPYLLRTHGEAYRSYARRVGRFFPGVGRYALTRAAR